MNHSKKWSKKAISMALVAAMVGTSVMPTFAASTDPNASAKREATNAAISQKAATQGMVLLENNNNSLPIAQTKGTKVALFGQSDNQVGDTKAFGCRGCSVGQSVGSY